jgi:hypothetical protein
MDAKLKRYKMCVNLYDHVDVIEDAEGFWVKFEDVKEIIEDLECNQRDANDDSGCDWVAYNEDE